jgi:hypothetical protein
LRAVSEVSIYECHFFVVKERGEPQADVPGEGAGAGIALLHSETAYVRRPGTQGVTEARTEAAAFLRDRATSPSGRHGRLTMENMKSVKRRLSLRRREGLKGSQGSQVTREQGGATHSLAPGCPCLSAVGGQDCELNEVN